LLEGEVIEQVVQIDDGWASGVSQDGARAGMFPSNYVEIMEAEEEVQPVEETPAAPLLPPPSHAAAGGNPPFCVALYD